MDLRKLKKFIKNASYSANPAVANAAQQTNQDIDYWKEQEDFAIPEMDDGHQPMEEEDIMLSKALPEMEQPDPNDKSTFGKVGPAKAASYYDLLQKKLTPAKEKTATSLLSKLYGKRNDGGKTTPKK